MRDWILGLVIVAQLIFVVCHHEKQQKVAFVELVKQAQQKAG